MEVVHPRPMKSIDETWNRNNYGEVFKPSENQRAKKYTVWDDSSGSEVTEHCTQMKHTAKVNKSQISDNK